MVKKRKRKKEVKKDDSSKNVLSYLGMFALIGFLFWFLNGLIVSFRQHSEQTVVYELAYYLWDGSLILIAVFATFWLIRKMKEWEVVR